MLPSPFKKSNQMPQRVCASIIGYSQYFKGVYSTVGKSTYCANGNTGLVCLLLHNNWTNRIKERSNIGIEMPTRQHLYWKMVWHPNPWCIRPTSNLCHVQLILGITCCVHKPTLGFGLNTTSHTRWYIRHSSIYQTNINLHQHKYMWYGCLYNCRNPR